MSSSISISPYPSPSPAPAPAPAPAVPRTVILRQQSSQPSKSAVDFSPPLIAMVAVVAAAFLIVSYSRLISRHLLCLHRRLSSRRSRRRRYVPSPSSFDLSSPPPFFDSPDAGAGAFRVCSPYGLDDAVIKTIPLSLYTAKGHGHSHRARDCAVCLLEFEESDYVRTLPACGHAFHVDCIDMWLRSHANCPLCRAGIYLLPESPFVPLMAARIRPSLDEDAILRDIILEEPVTAATEVSLNSPNGHPSNHANGTTVTEIVEEQSPRRMNPLSEDRTSNARDFLLKRSYSFGFERSLASERLVLEPVTASPWRYRRVGAGGFWSKRLSPFGSLPKPRVFSFRYYRGMKSPFFKRRGGGGGGGGAVGFFPLSESSVRFSSGASGGGGGSSRRSKSIASPMFARPSGAAAFSSSRLRCGDPEALLSPERFSRR
ncbi:hypothetical protein BT93_I1472 [Corymbia citriodora subsp. variegata]|nr:hypothetical protein BT93_I1472 [Corymbia citriodora subsp. variegata]